MAVPQNIKVESSGDLAIPLLCTHPKELKAGTHTDICTQQH